MHIKEFNLAIDYWIKELAQYNFESLRINPSPQSWSLGQLVTHLINDTHYFIEQIKICVATDDNAAQQHIPFAQTLFLNKDFPDQKIEGNPNNASIPQPSSKKELIIGLNNLKEEMNAAALLIEPSQHKGKTKHPGLGYFNADEWLQFAGIHFRHHLRQKKRIDEFLGK